MNSDLYAIVSSFISKEEGNIPYAYKDSEGYLTIGIGFLIDKDKGGFLYPEEINFIFSNRLTKLYDALSRSYSWFSSLDNSRKTAILSLAYQLGLSGLSKFTKALEAMKNKDYSLASNEFLDSKWAKQVPARAERTVKLIRDGG